jgi:hypothetical protein
LFFSHSQFRKHLSQSDLLNVSLRCSIFLVALFFPSYFSLQSHSFSVQFYRLRFFLFAIWLLSSSRRWFVIWMQQIKGIKWTSGQVMSSEWKKLKRLNELHEKWFGTETRSENDDRARKCELKYGSDMWGERCGKGNAVKWKLKSINLRPKNCHKNWVYFVSENDVDEDWSRSF